MKFDKFDSILANIGFYGLFAGTYPLIGLALLAGLVAVVLVLGR